MSDRRNVRTLLGGLTTVVMLAAQVVAGTAPAGASAPITTFTAPTIANPREITSGADGALWFTNRGNSIGRVTTGGSVSDFTDPQMSNPTGIAAGPDGALWFTNDFSIGRITTGGTITHLIDPSISEPVDITVGPDGALWFTNSGNNTIGRITTGGTVTSFSDPSIADPQYITTGPDGALWFTNYLFGSDGQRSIVRVTTSGTFTRFTDPGIVWPISITTGPDGALWFTDHLDAIGRMTTSGVVTRYERPAIADPSGIVSGVDGALWFTNSGNNTIGRITTGGTVTSFSDPSIANPQDITTGPDGALWFTNPSNNSIGRIVAADATHTPSSPVQCKHGGWRALTDELGDPFRNQGQCVSWTNHHLQPPVGLSDLAGSFSFTGATSVTGQFPACGGDLRQVFDVTYPASAAVGNATLHIEGCLSPTLTLYTGAFTITTNVGMVSGVVSGPITFTATIDYELILTVSSGTDAFRGTTGVLHSELVWDGPPVTVVTGSVSST